MSIQHLKVFRELTGADSRIGFYTKETRGQIPEVGGCYAWLLPLWIYRDDLDELLNVAGTLLNYDPSPEREVDARFNWERVSLRVRRNVDTQPTGRIHRAWKHLLDRSHTRDALQQLLLETSLLMPPLYVGRADNLKRRYLQHTQIERQERNDFHMRFKTCVERSHLKIDVSDLIFVCISTPAPLRRVFGKALADGRELDELIEQILMQLCRPPFSLR